jgi:DNA modification methylase
MMPERLAMALINDGWILRNKIIWNKPNAMPSSVKDRFSNKWEYVYLFSKSRKYFFDLDAVRIPHKYPADVMRRIRQDKTSGVNPFKKGIPGCRHQNVFNIRVRDAQKGRLQQKWGDKYTATQEEIDGYDEKNYQGKFSGIGNEQSEGFGSPRARTQRNTKLTSEKYEVSGMISPSKRQTAEGLSHNDFYHPIGKNPGDVITTRVESNIEHFRKKGSGGHYDYGGIDSPDGKHEHPSGKNPGDVFYTHKEGEPQGHTSIKNRMAYKRRVLGLDHDHCLDHPHGKNPGDVIRLSPKYEQPGGHSNRQGLNRELDIVTLKAYREYQKPIAEYLKNHILSKHKPILDKCFGEHKWKHWIRTDLSGASLPGVDDWHRLKEILGFDDTFDDKIYEVQKLNIPVFQSGRNPGDFWTITTRPFKGAHFAVFPEALVVTPIMAGCPEQVCCACGKPRERISKVVGRQVTDAMRIAGCDKLGNYKGQNQKKYSEGKAQSPSDSKRRILGSMSQIKDIVGWSDCGCGKGFRAGVVLDPFAGSGTVGVVARRLLRNYILIDFLIDLKQEYVEMARERLKKIPHRLEGG